MNQKKKTMNFLIKATKLSKKTEQKSLEMINKELCPRFWKI